MKLTPHTRPIAISVASALLFLAIVALPHFSEARFRSIQDEGRRIFEFEDITDDVIRQRVTTWRTLRRDYTHAMEIYRDLLRVGVTDIPKPDINDNATIQLYLKPGFLDKINVDLSLKGAAPLVDTQTFMADYDDIYEDDQDLVDFYAKTFGMCPKMLQRHHIQGFWELCEAIRIANKTMRRASDVLGVRPDLRGFRRPRTDSTIKNRLRIQREAWEGTLGRRKDVRGKILLWPTHIPFERLKLD